MLINPHAVEVLTNHVHALATPREEHKRKREGRQRKRDEATKKSMSDVNQQERLTAEEIRREDTRNQIAKARREDCFSLSKTSKISFRDSTKTI